MVPLQVFFGSFVLIMWRITRHKNISTSLTVSFTETNFKTFFITITKFSHDVSPKFDLRLLQHITQVLDPKNGWSFFHEILTIILTLVYLISNMALIVLLEWLSLFCQELCRRDTEICYYILFWGFVISISYSIYTMKVPPKMLIVVTVKWEK